MVASFFDFEAAALKFSRFSLTLDGMKQFLALVLAFSLLAPKMGAGTTVIHAEPLNQGHIDPMLFGNFIELLDDVVPGMWSEMLNDRSFEGTGKLSGWCYYDGSPDVCDRQWDANDTWSLDTQNPFNGARCARISRSLTQSGLAVKLGMKYTFTGHLRADDAKAGAVIELKALLPTGKWMTLASAEIGPLSTVWKKYTTELISTGATDRAVFEFRVQGQGTIWADKLSLMPADNVQGWRRDVIDVIKDAQPALVRFGGSVCDPGEYRWKSGIGDRDARAPFPNKVWGRLDPNDVGIDEFCQFCEITGVAPLICLSFSGGPQDAADLVDYCNGSAQTAWGARRAANGHPAPYGVKYWQIGNEISGDDDNYLAQIPRFVKLMKQNDPSIQILSSFPSQKLLDRVGRDLAFIAPHHYTTDLGACENDFNSLARLINTTPGCADVKIAVTEWNTSGGNWGLGRAQQMTLDTALRNARYLHVLMRHCDKAKIACRSNMANSFCGAIIETSPAGVLKRPSYYVMQLYARHAQPLPLKMDGSGDGPDLFACAAEDRKSIVIFAINDKLEPLPWSWKFDGFNGVVTPVQAATLCDTQDARQPDMENHWNAPDRIRTVALPLSPDKVTLPALSVTAIEFRAD